MSTTAVGSSSTIQMDYMKLLVTQLQNQNPLEPMSNDQMSAQLTQFSQLEQLESMGTDFAKVLETTELNYAASLLDKKITFYTPDGLTGALEMKKGSVASVFNDRETGESLLGVTVGEGEGMEEYTLSLNAIVLIEN
jgi:flagellar basal-body rod modification protein FlgD